MGKLIPVTLTVLLSGIRGTGTGKREDTWETNLLIFVGEKRCNCKWRDKQQKEPAKRQKKKKKKKEENMRRERLKTMTETLITDSLYIFMAWRQVHHKEFPSLSLEQSQTDASPSLLWETTTGRCHKTYYLIPFINWLKSLWRLLFFVHTTPTEKLLQNLIYFINYFHT